MIDDRWVVMVWFMRMAIGIGGVVLGCRNDWDE